MFIGEFKEGYPNGRAVRAYKNGSRYEGDIDAKTSTMHGQGEMIYKSRLRYEGMWKFDQRDDYGKLEFPTGSRFEGERIRDIAKRGILCLVRGKPAGLSYTLFPDGGGWVERSQSVFSNATVVPALGQLVSPREHKHALESAMDCGLPSSHTVLGEQEVVPFQTIRHLGHGTYGTVDEIRSIATGSVFARKVIRLQTITRHRMLPSLEKEVQVMRCLLHQHIVKIVRT